MDKKTSDKKTSDKEISEKKKTCFVIMPISDADGYDKGHFTRVFEHLIKPACIEAGFEPIRADDSSKADIIMVDILQKILECDMAICDLSARNPNVFYELGFRQAFNKKTVLIKDEKTKMPFDTSSIRTITYNESLRIDEVKASIPRIADGIKETFSNTDDTGYSLLKLLSIQKPASIPEGHKLSNDSNVILNAIRDIGKQIELIDLSRPDSNSTKNLEYTFLPSKDIAFAGEEIYLNSPDSKTKYLLGKFYKETIDAYYILDDLQIVKIDKSSEEAKRLTTLY